MVELLQADGHDDTGAEKAKAEAPADIVGRLGVGHEGDQRANQEESGEDQGGAPDQLQQSHLVAKREEREKKIKQKEDIRYPHRNDQGHNKVATCTCKISEPYVW